MAKKTEHEVLYSSRFFIKTSDKDSHEANLRLRRFGTRFIVDKSGFYGQYACHMDYYDNVEEAYADYARVLDIYQDCLD